MEADDTMAALPSASHNFHPVAIQVSNTALILSSSSSFILLPPYAKSDHCLDEDSDVEGFTQAGSEEQEDQDETSAGAAAEVEMDVMSPHTPFGDGAGGTERPGRSTLLSGFTGSTRKGWGKPGFWAGVAGMGSAIKVKVNGLSDLTRAEDLGEIFGLLGATSQVCFSLPQCLCFLYPCLEIGQNLGQIDECVIQTVAVIAAFDPRP